MGRETSIEWTEATWNPVRGCSRVSRGCEHCYAESVARRFSGPGQPYEGLVRLDRDGKAKAQWNGTVRLVYEHLGDPIRWTKPRRIFVNSMSDLFHEALAFEHVAAIFGVMASSPKHVFQILTKRPARAREFFAWLDRREEQGRAMFPDDAPSWRIGQLLARELSRFGLSGARPGTDATGWEDFDPRRQPWPLPNVWIGVSVEDQQSADERIPDLLACPAAVRWVSYEPALGPIDFRRWTLAEHGRHHIGAAPGLSWIVVGGESGPGARPFDLSWARSTIAQCRASGIACFVKQLGADPHVYVPPSGAPDDGGDFVPIGLADRKGGDMGEWPEDLRVREMPAGRTP